VRAVTVGQRGPFPGRTSYKATKPEFSFFNVYFASWYFFGLLIHRFFCTFVTGWVNVSEMTYFVLQQCINRCNFYPRDACCHRVSVRLSVRLSQAGTVPKRLTQDYANNAMFPDAKKSRRNFSGITPNGAQNKSGIWFKRRSSTNISLCHRNDASLIGT